MLAWASKNPSICLRTCFSPAGFKGNLSLITGLVFFPPGLKQMEESRPSLFLQFVQIPLFFAEDGSWARASGLDLKTLRCLSC